MRGKVAGPIVITHTKNDVAVGIAYPIAYHFAREDAADLGDGKTSSADRPRRRLSTSARGGGRGAAGRRWRLAVHSGKLYDLRADRWISVITTWSDPVANACSAPPRAREEAGRATPNPGLAEASGP